LRATAVVHSVFGPKALQACGCGARRRTVVVSMSDWHLRRWRRREVLCLKVEVSNERIVGN